MNSKLTRDVPPSEITPHAMYERRREFMKLAAGVSILGATSALSPRARAQENSLLSC